MDGGGSVTMILRNEEGVLETVNKPSDGSDRSIYNGLFFVVKDVEAEVNTTKISQDFVEMDVNISDYGVSGNITNTYLNLSYVAKNGKTFNESYEIKDGKVVANNLSPNVTYTYKIQFKVEGNDKLYSSYFSGQVTTAKSSPLIKEVRLENVDGKLRVYVAAEDDSKAIVGYMKISFDNGKTYHNLQSNGSLTFENIDFDPLDGIAVKFYCDLNDGAGNQEIVLNEFTLNCSIAIYFDSIKYKNSLSFERDRNPSPSDL